MQTASFSLSDGSRATGLESWGGGFFLTAGTFNSLRSPSPWLHGEVPGEAPALISPQDGSSAALLPGWQSPL